MAPSDDRPGASPHRDPIEELMNDTDDPTHTESDAPSSDAPSSDAVESDAVDADATVVDAGAGPARGEAAASTDRLGEARRAVEAILLVADVPVPTQLLAEVLELPTALVDDLCFELAEQYEQDGRGFLITRVAGGYRLQTHPDLAGYVERFVLDGQAARLSQAALETLAIVAYKQPISRAQVAQIRGVNVDGVMRTLVQRGYVAEIGQDSGPGQASLFGTTSAFLESIGLDGLADLPPLGDMVPDATVMEALEEHLRVGRRPADAVEVPLEVAPGDPNDGNTPEGGADDGAADEPDSDAGTPAAGGLTAVDGR